MRACLLPLLFCCVSGACRGEPDGEAYGARRDLLAELPAAEVAREVAVLDVGTPAARRHLISGFHADEVSADGATTFAWSAGEESVVEFYLAAPRELRLGLRLSPLSFEGAPPQRLAVAINGRPLAGPAPELAAGLADYALDLPAEALNAGRNRLRFRYARVAAPAEVGLSTDHRRLAVAFDELRFSLPGAAAPRADGSGALLLPAGGEVSFYPELATPARLVWSGVTLNGGARLEILARREGEPERLLRRLEGNAGAGGVALPGEGWRLLRLTLRAVPPRRDAAGGAAGEARVAAPALRFVPPPPPSSPSPPRPAAGRPSVLIYLVDTLRADRLGCYGNPRGLTPHADAFAASALLFENAVAQSSWTKPAVASVLTGLDPLGHGVEHFDGKLPRSARVLPELLREAGYRTAAVSTNWHISPEAGFAQGFQDFLFTPRDPLADAAVDRAVEWLEGRVESDGGDARKPFFLYLHTIDPHAPYLPPEPFRGRFAASVTRPGAGAIEDLRRTYGAEGEERARRMADYPPLYDGEVAFNDHHFGRLMAELERLGLFDGTFILYLSDHGEEFDEHGDLGHGNNLYGESLNIPLLLKPPRWREGRRVAAPAQHLDVLPTLLAHLGLEIPAGLPGADLLALARLEEAGHRPPARPLFSHLNYEGKAGLSAVYDGWKSIEPWTALLAPRPELYHRAEDPLDTRDLLELHPVRAGHLATLLRARRNAATEAGRPTQHHATDDELREGLRALGYVE